MCNPINGVGKNKNQNEKVSGYICLILHVPLDITMY